MKTQAPFYVQKGKIYAVPIIHYNMEMAAQVNLAFHAVKPDCIAVELPEIMQSQMEHAASRLPDISVVVAESNKDYPLFFLCEPCDPVFEALRLALEHSISRYCIDLDVEFYPHFRDFLPDPYAIHRIGLKAYYALYHSLEDQAVRSRLDDERENLMASRLKELSQFYERILFVGGMAHIAKVLEKIDDSNLSIPEHAYRESIKVYALTETSCRDVLAECGWFSEKYELHRENMIKEGPLDRQKLILELYKEAGNRYKEHTGNAFLGYHLRNTMKFARNYAFIRGYLLPDFFKIVTAAKCCVDHNYAYEVWELATTYPFRRNIDGLPELNLSIEQIWGMSKRIHFHMKEKGRKNSSFIDRYRKSHSSLKFKPPGPFTICSYPPEDLSIERFGNFLKKKGSQILTEEAARTIPFSTSLEDGIDTKETIRRWHEHKLYVKTSGKPPKGVGSVCVIFDEDKPEEGKEYREKFSWRTTWLGEHQQESDMAFYATSMTQQIVGPGICRCEYGGFMMSYPPRRMMNIWSDPDYQDCRSKSEVLLMAAIDYAVKPVIVYVANSAPRASLKNFARRFGKKIVYIPIGQLSPITLNKLRVFHVLDGHHTREIADDYIF